jgi:hypothetical protein
MGNPDITPRGRLTFAVGDKSGGERPLLLSWATPGAFFADATFGYRGSGASVAVAPGTWFRAGDHMFEIADSDATDHHQTTEGGLKLYIHPDASGVLSFEAFGPDMTGGADSSGHLAAALAAAKRLNASTSVSIPGASASFPTPRLNLGMSRALNLVSKVTCANINGVEIVGTGGVIKGSFADYLLELTGSVMNARFKDFTIQGTGTGCFRIDANNVSAARVEFDGIRFVTDATGSDTGIGVLYTNRSSTLMFRRCFFNRLAHPLHLQNCDFVSFYDCWFGLPSYAAYPDKDGYIRCEKGFLDIDRCLFAGGPGWYSGKKSRAGAALSEYVETAYIKMGVDGVAEAADADNGRVSIRNTRIGFESGAAPLVNWMIPHKPDSGTAWRGGILLQNVISAPQENKAAAVDGTPAPALLRLFTMPHQIQIDGVHTTLGNVGLITPGSTTSLAELRSVVPAPVDHKSSLASQQAPQSYRVYSAHNITAGKIHMTLASGNSDAENKRWLELFGAFDYFFPSDYPLDTSGGNAPTVTVTTWFSDFSTDRRAAVFEVFGDARPSVASGGGVETPILGYVTVARDERGTDTLFAQYTATAGIHSSVTPVTTVTAKLKVGASAPTAAIPATDAANALLVLELQHSVQPGIANVRCSGLIVRPLTADFARQRGMRMIQHYTRFAE